MSHSERMIGTWSLARIVETLGAQLRAPAGRATTHPSRAWTDTRSIEPGDLFIALSGPHFDGHDYLRQAQQRGAIAALVTHVPEDAPDDLALIVCVEDAGDPRGALSALQRLGRACWARASERGIRGVAITGSNGKTTTKEVLRCLWRARGEPTDATSGNFNNHIGVPLTLCNASASARTWIIEMGANAPGDIAELIAIAPCPVRVITSIGHAHIEGFGSLDGVRRAKREIFLGMPEGARAVVPIHEHRALIEEHEERIAPSGVVTCGAPGSGADVTWSVEHEREQGMRIALRRAQASVTLDVALYGAHNAANVASAVATLPPSWWGDQDALQRALDALEIPGNRSKRVQIGEQYVVIDDAYNANPTSMVASAHAFAGLGRALSWPGPRAVVVGEMLELGPDAENWHVEAARSIAEIEDVHAIVCVGRFGPQMAEAARAARPETAFAVERAESAREAADAIKRIAPDHAVILLKASRGARLERVIDELRGTDARDP